MLACSSCRRFVRDDSASCPFCGQALVDGRSPLGGFLGVILGVALTACGGGDDGDDGASASASETATVTGTGTATTNGVETTGPLYGPVSDSGTDTDGSGTDTGDVATGTESAGPLYGPASG